MPSHGLTAFEVFCLFISKALGGTFLSNDLKLNPKVPHFNHQTCSEHGSEGALRV